MEYFSSPLNLFDYATLQNKILFCIVHLWINGGEHIIEDLEELQRLKRVKRDKVVRFVEGLFVQLLNNELHLFTQTHLDVTTIFT